MNMQYYIRCCVVLMMGVLVFGACEQHAKIPDFEAIENVQEKKERFFSFMLPHIKSENQKILRQRQKLLDLKKQSEKNTPLSGDDALWLRQVASKYEIGFDPESQKAPWQKLLLRVDTVPAELALIQAAVESAWGTSRFAKQGYNMFGEHCVTEGCGIEPAMRADAPYEVEVFDSISGSVRSYIHNLNTHDAYKDFRILRQQFRKNGKTPDAHSLAAALHNYSERENAYTEDLQAMINSNRKLMERL